MCTESPPPGQYNMNSEFDIGSKTANLLSTKSHLYSFGQPFAVYKKVFNPENPVGHGLELLPGPG